MSLARTSRPCLVCGIEIPADSNPLRQYCDAPCKRRAKQRRKRARDKRTRQLVAVSDEHHEGSRRLGSTYRSLVASGDAARIYDGSLTATAAAEIHGVTVAAVSRAMTGWRSERAKDLAAEDWEMDPTIAAMFPKDLFDELGVLGLDAEGSEPFERIMERILEAFWCAQHRYFTIGSRQLKMIVKPFHHQMARELVISHVFGARVLLLTPPRHGKSEVLIRWYWWLLVMYPNHQILWVAANTDLAGDMGRKLKATFEYNQLMNDELLPPNQIFGSERSSKPWTDNSFTLDTRTDRTLKSASFTGLGATSTIAGRDADEIGIDDLEERKTVATADLRQLSKTKHSEIMERQEDHTGAATIASRQHMDDIAHALMEETDPDLAWRVSQFPAHFDNCELDPDVIAGHDSNGCMLFPEVRSYKWLLRQRRENETLGLPGRYELRYLQKSVPVGGYIFDIPRIRSVCFDRSRGLGVEGIPAGWLVAGLDPSARARQAGFTWSYTDTALYMVDLETQHRGGFAGAHDLMRAWSVNYGVRDWYYEDNSQQIEFFRDPRFQQLRDELGLNVLSHTTGKNKHDPELGITSMAPWYHDGFINLPYGTDEARRKVNLFLRDLEIWTDGAKARPGRSDIKMASWFPFPRLVALRAVGERELSVEIEDSGYGVSYPGIGSFSNMNQAPWR